MPRGKDHGKYWTALVFIDNVPLGKRDDLQGAVIDIMSGSKLPCAVSPLHHGDGKDGKPHVHINIAMGTTTTRGAVLDELCNLFHTPPSPEPIRNRGAADEYLTHANNPEKEQFSPADLPVCLNGYVLAHTKGGDIACLRAFSAAIESGEVTSLRDAIGHVDTATGAVVAPLSDEVVNWVIGHAYLAVQMIKESHYLDGSR